MTTRPRWIAAVVLLAGCGDRMRALAEPRPAARPAAYLAVAEIGRGAVRVTAHTTETVSPASFTARLLFDTAAVTAVREDTLADGALRAVHVRGGVVRVAGGPRAGIPRHRDGER